VSTASSSLEILSTSVPAMSVKTTLPEKVAEIDREILRLSEAISSAEETGVHLRNALDQFKSNQEKLGNSESEIISKLEQTKKELETIEASLITMKEYARKKENDIEEQASQMKTVQMQQMQLLSKQILEKESQTKLLEQNLKLKLTENVQLNQLCDQLLLKLVPSSSVM